ncbi:hypothetical protein PILCRDRAFT_137395 [Piloderma croceum F 1598]|uniref:Uncharacterized protein n=1 Tax=Piloderma croceum (strain F 1598) TaxID=765440 RepID=A0A0C3CPU1_PILCF|nr:hypothetical protein PILCRDRAFT_137395 [Piloderma croceum F 1598]
MLFGTALVFELHEAISPPTAYHNSMFSFMKGFSPPSSRNNRVAEHDALVVLYWHQAHPEPLSQEKVSCGT